MGKGGVCGTPGRIHYVKHEVDLLTSAFASARYISISVNLFLSLW